MGAFLHLLINTFFMVGPCNISDSSEHSRAAIAIPSVPPTLPLASQLDRKLLSPSTKVVAAVAVVLIMWEFDFNK